MMRRLTDPEELARLLNRDWRWAGFAIGDLEPEWMPHCEWWQAGDSVVLLFDGLTPRLLCHLGGASGLTEILGELREARVWGNIRLEFAELFGQYYRAGKVVRMRRMCLEGRVAGSGAAVSLGVGDREEIEELLREGEWVLFLPQCLAGGHYFGVREKGRLVAVAGTHLASVRHDIAAIGTVFTHPEHRGKGLAQVCCREVLGSLGRAGIGRVVLNVLEENAGARGVYQRLGFRSVCTYLDGEYVQR